MTTISTPESLLRVLSEDAEWKAAVRREILTADLINLPVRFERFMEQQLEFNAELREFNAQQRQFNAQQLEFNAEQRQFNAEQRQFNAQQREFNAQQLEFNVQTERAIARLGRDIANLRADYARNNAVREAPGLAVSMGFQLIRTLDSHELVELARAGDTSDLTPGEVESFHRADLVIMVADADGATHYIAVEISFTADERDTSRALRNARLLTRFTGHPAHAAVVSVRIVNEIRDAIASGQVHWHELDDRGPVVE